MGALNTGLGIVQQVNAASGEAQSASDQSLVRQMIADGSLPDKPDSPRPVPNTGLGIVQPPNAAAAGAQSASDQDIMQQMIADGSLPDKPENPSTGAPF